jgi:hypothetical protein
VIEHCAIAKGRLVTGSKCTGLKTMGYNARNDEIRDNATRMRREWEAQRGALATVRRFNATLSAKGYSWFWPKIASALTSKHHWLIINCDSCGTVVDLDLSVKPRDPEASIRVALRDVQCPRCNGYGRPRGNRRFERIKGAITWPKSERQKRQKSNASEPRRKVSLKRATTLKSMFLSLMFQMKH